MDPWKHRSTMMKCRTCMWFVLKAGPPVPLTVPDHEIPAVMEGGMLGRCRRHAPTMNGYPAVYESDWCGDHKLDETKIGGGA